MTGDVTVALKRGTISGILHKEKLFFGRLISFEFRHFLRTRTVQRYNNFIYVSADIGANSFWIDRALPLGVSAIHQRPLVIVHRRTSITYLPSWQDL